MPNHVDNILNIDCNIESVSEIVGEISDNVEKLTGSFSTGSVIQINNIDIPKVINEELYDENYSVIPSVNEQVLNTRKKIMKQDVIIEEIPTFWTSNATGMTFIIGN